MGCKESDMTEQLTLSLFHTLKYQSHGTCSPFRLQNWTLWRADSLKVYIECLSEKRTKFHLKFLHQIPWITVWPPAPSIYSTSMGIWKKHRETLYRMMHFPGFYKNLGCGKSLIPSFSILGSLPCPSVTCNCQNHGLRALSFFSLIL